MFLLSLPINAKAEDNKGLMKVSEVPPKIFEITAGDIGVNTIKIAINPQSKRVSESTT